MTYVKDLPIGSRIREKESGTVFLVADHHHTGWEGTTLVSDRICMISCIDAAEPENPDEQAAASGYNRYALSNIHQWLNSAKDHWYEPQHAFDTPPSEDRIAMRTDVFTSKMFDPEGIFPAPYAYDQLPGYLARFSEGFREAILPSPVICFGPSDPDIIYFGPPQGETISCKAFLLSAAEIGLEDEIRREGYLIRLFLDPRMRMSAPENKAIHQDPDFDYKQSPVAFWLRSPFGSTTGMGKIYQVEHKFGDVVGATLMPHPVNYAAGIRPAMNLDDMACVCGRDEYGIYQLQL